MLTKFDNKKENRKIENEKRKEVGKKRGFGVFELTSKLTLSSDDLGHVFAAGYRDALGHVLALLGSRLLEDACGSGL